MKRCQDRDRETGSFRLFFVIGFSSRSSELEIETMLVRFRTMHMPQCSPRSIQEISHIGKEVLANSDAERQLTWIIAWKEGWGAGALALEGAGFLVVVGAIV